MSAREEAYVPSHPDLFEVEFRPGDYCSALIARKVRLRGFAVFFGGVRASSNHFCLSQDYQAGEVMVYLTGLTTGPKSYATLQCGPGPDDHVLPASDLVYGVPGF